MNENQRNNIRINFKTEATVTYKQRKISGTVKDLSMSGLFLLTDQKVDERSLFDVEVKLSGTSSDVSVACKGEHIRSTDNGFAIKFVEMEIDSYSILKYIVMYSKDEVT